ncbi:MATE efflux family protein [Geobacter metallireducens RCH3]|uniref:MatE-like domain efflux pump n=1 Tax=Geobacter metallireducens (strain ATCC 53774 / DSM 7210 / GS-15) TaxID=269799 RepID=Q39SP4_GEOMG|nr:MATE family efflux transporter [Geobacter metallireducens]ABB32730.1 MatE-like domain efflux pump [Geobacter metallireducens GS-15]EHP83821.1 MATE efflux family protein [Geobacter metallireducens RCH3]
MTSPDLINDPIPKLLTRLAVPVGTGFFFNTMFNVVDTFYGGLISTRALAALSLSFPLFFIVLAIGAGTSMGATALIGHALGSDQREEAELFAAQAISFGVIHALFMTVGGVAAAPALFRLMGASGDYLDLALAYMDVIIAGTVFFVGNYVLNAMLNASGDTKSFRNFLVAGCFLNMALDPWFMYGGVGVPALGIRGIALATVVVQAAGNVYLLGRVRRTGLLSGRSWQLLMPRREPFRRLFGQGIPASMNMLTVSLGMFVITWFAGRFGKEVVAAYGIGTRIEQIVLLPAFGLNVAVLSLVAQNFGAGKLRRIRETLTRALRAGLLMMAGGTTLVFAAAEPLMKLFTADPLVVAHGVTFLRVESLLLGAYVILYMNNSALQGLQRPAFALWIGLFRQIIVPVPIFWLLALVLGWGPPGIWWGFFLVTWSAAMVSVLYTRRVLRLATEEADAALMRNGNNGPPP